MVVPGPPDYDEWGKLVAKDPDFETMGPQFNCGDATWQTAVEVGLWRSDSSSSAETKSKADSKPGVGTLVEVYFDDGKWYPGTIQSQDESGKFRIEFSDGDVHEVEDLENDSDIRIISVSPKSSKPREADRFSKPESGPWATWLDTYLPDLLHSSFRSARLGKVDKHLITRILDSGKATNPPSKRARRRP